MKDVIIDTRIFVEIGYLQGVVNGISMRSDISIKLTELLTKIYQESKKRTDKIMEIKNER